MVSCITSKLWFFMWSNLSTVSLWAVELLGPTSRNLGHYTKVPSSQSPDVALNWDIYGLFFTLYINGGVFLLGKKNTTHTQNQNWGHGYMFLPTQKQTKSGLLADGLIKNTHGVLSEHKVLIRKNRRPVWMKCVCVDIYFLKSMPLKLCAL